MMHSVKIQNLVHVHAYNIPVQLRGYISNGRSYYIFLQFLSRVVFNMVEKHNNSFIVI